MPTAVRILTARYKGTCAGGCGRPIRKGDTIAYFGKNNSMHVECQDGTVVDANQGLTDTIRPVRVTTVRTSSGWTGTRNVRGRCEDAPCCGCCTY